MSSTHASPALASEVDRDIVIRLTDITKRFPGIVANDAISLDVRRGEVHCLLGENGAGKSTLISILAGLQQPDEGSIEMNGVPTVLSSPAVSIAQGIGVVYQHSALIPTLTVLENLMLSDESNFWLDKTSAAARLAELSELLGAEIDPHMLAGDLGLGQQQQVEIAKAMWKGSEVLILDEPTSMLTPQAIDSLVESVNRLKAEGLAVIFISHKLHEAYAIGDAVTILRAGYVAGRIAPEEMHAMTEEQAKDRILEAMFGSNPETISAEQAEAAGAAEVERRGSVAADAQTVLEIAGLTTTSESGEVAISDVSLAIRAGEILGIAGIDGHGQRHLAETIAGQRTPASGSVSLDGTDVTKYKVKARQNLGVRYVTDDRLHEGIVGNLSVALNLVLKKIGESPFWRLGRMDRDAVMREADDQIAEYEIRTPSKHTRAGTLSGGNIQKILLARELSHDPRVVIFHKPTYGLDLKTVYRVRETVRDFARQGGAVLLISTDLDELAELSDRVAVVSNGRIIGEVVNDGDHVTERIGEMMVGMKTTAHSNSPEDSEQEHV
ncbi:putative B6 ABC transporter ATP-binding protein [Leucobacter denitrificans]|uniref:ABC transporter ATP-binding protein n=1 Tax=Leucobacter denitrificans TaxID=683042 RepID=A0A7G9S391_9MICO|nr:ABC transporter ATP-binding protein [Leucobacter denitrificans]QNN62316.1 ABC transporter ATP-binding protein [Leucobacter denitrificans]